MNSKNKIIFKGDYTTIFGINSNKYGYFEVKVDTEDIDKIKDYKWHVHFEKTGKRFKAIKASPKFKEKAIHLHSLVTGFEMSDHIDGDIFNNRKSNLRNCTHLQNSKNMRKHRDNKSGYKGVTKSHKKWLSRITVDGNLIRLGLFVSKKEAAQAYNEASIKYHGEFSKINNII